ncbi:helix-turn-helix domain-containing protein [Paenibacillus senegalensis]|uniref:helix-turn-helix domain-containing protein n=1 Tax=Paenibacillus senegalensis TaxID=1465766 RepID=UPI00028884E5|nr:helix-turn-helix domain-containing protein [Paenibacillus senegalensis]
MRRFFPVKLKTFSLLIRLLLGFLTVILLLVSFNFLSFTFFQNNIRGEIIRNNEQNTEFTTKKYEEQFTLIQKQIYSLYFNEHVTRMRNSPGNAKFEALDMIRSEIARIIDNPLLYVDNIFLVFKDNGLTLSKTGTTEKSNLFEKFYASPDYPDEFWSEQFQGSYSSALFAASVFYEHPFYDHGEPTAKGLFMPYIVKHYQQNDFYIVAMLDANKMFNAFNSSANSSFYIIDDKGTPIYPAEASGIELAELALPADQTHIHQDNTYYFYRSGGDSKLTYLSIVPGKHISSQVSQLNMTLLVLLALALIISLFVSIIFSIRFNNPIQQIVGAIQQWNGRNVTVRTGIREFELIGSKLNDMLRTNSRIERDLAQKNELLAPYSYLNRLKKIYMGPHTAAESLPKNRPYQFMIFEITYKALYWEEVREDADRSTYFIRETIDRSVSTMYPHSLTFQVENRQIVSVVYEPDPAAQQEWLDMLLSILGKDSSYYFFTICLSPMYPAGADFTTAYEETVKLLQERQLNEETQVLRLADRSRKSAHLFTPDQDRQFDAHLEAGNSQRLLEQVDRHLLSMERKQATVKQFKEFAVDIVQKVRKLFHARRLDEQMIEAAISHLHAVDSFYSVKQYRMFFSQLLITACETIGMSKESEDKITDFVLQYVEKHYAEDITLDIVASQLAITGGYLSTYFKEKTGKNFVDYVNEVRIREAQRLLLNTNNKIQEVALNSGYQNLNSFNRMFKKLNGVTPREFRKMHLQTAGEE